LKNEDSSGTGHQHHLHFLGNILIFLPQSAIAFHQFCLTFVFLTSILEGI
jgi:hypothetical protein